MSLLDLPKVHMTAKARPGRKSQALVKLEIAERALSGAKSRHKRAADRLTRSKEMLRSATRTAEMDKKSEEAAFARVTAVMVEYERIKKLCEED